MVPQIKVEERTAVFEPFENESGKSFLFARHDFAYFFFCPEWQQTILTWLSFLQNLFDLSARENLVNLLCWLMRFLESRGALYSFWDQKAIYEFFFIISASTMLLAWLCGWVHYLIMARVRERRRGALSKTRDTSSHLLWAIKTTRLATKSGHIGIFCFFPAQYKLTLEETLFSIINWLWLSTEKTLFDLSCARIWSEHVMWPLETSTSPGTCALNSTCK